MIRYPASAAASAARVGTSNAPPGVRQALASFWRRVSAGGASSQQSSAAATVSGMFKMNSCRGPPSAAAKLNSTMPAAGASRRPPRRMRTAHPSTTKLMAMCGI